MKVKYKPTKFPGETIFISGPISTNERGEPVTEEEREVNVRKAMDIAAEIMAMGHAVYLPHLDHWWRLHMLQTGRELEADDLMGLDFVFLEKCDAMFWIAPSAGSNEERKLAKKLGKKVYYSLSEISDARTKS